MSIPKEPRQLMINLMYLVLTALLALNVSAEVMNAFFDLDKSLKNSNELTEEGVRSTKAGIQDILDKKPLVKAPLNKGIDEVNEEVASFVAYIDEIRDKLLDASGNGDGVHDENDYVDNDYKHKPKGKKNTDVPTRLMVEGLPATMGYGSSGDTYKGEGPYGPEIAKRVDELKASLIDIYTRTVNNRDIMKEGKISKAEVDAKVEAFINSIPLSVESLEDIKAKAKEGTVLDSDDQYSAWSRYKFKQMPVAACLPALTKLQTDARNTQATAVNKFAELVGGKEIKLNKFFPVINAKKGYVIRGEKFEATVQIGAYSSEFGKNSTISINGQRVQLKNGVGTFTETANSTGKRTLNLASNVVNPLTGEKFSEKSTFEYEVGVRSANVSADKMNVFYIGVDNPISVTVAGASSNEVKASCSGAGCNIKGSRGKYTVTVSQPGDATVNVSGGGLPNTPFKFRVKRIPDPVARLGKKADGSMGNGEFRAQPGIIPWLDAFDFEARCKIDGFNVTRVAKRDDPIQKTNRGGTFTSETKRIINMAKPGDTYYFENVKARCPGDAAGRKINSMVFKIK